MSYIIPQKIECPECKLSLQYSPSENYFGLLKDKDGGVLCPICVANKLTELGVATMTVTGDKEL